MLDEILENKDDEPLETSETENEGTDSEPDVDENVKLRRTADYRKKKH